MIFNQLKFYFYPQKNIIPWLWTSCIKRSVLSGYRLYTKIGDLLYLVMIILLRHLIFRPIFLASVGDYNMAEPNLNREYAPEVPPLDIIEEVVNNQGWHLNRVCEEEMTAVYNGRWCDYSLHQSPLSTTVPDHHW